MIPGRTGSGQTGGAHRGSATGREWWRTLDELAGDSAFRERLYNEFPSAIEAIADPVARRTFLKLMGASLALAGVSGLAACTRQPPERILPYVRQPEELIPGKPLFFATAMALGGVATGLLVESHEGRPTKVEGNPLHPGSLGAADVFAQAAVLALYDPDRSQTITGAGEIQTWHSFVDALRATLAAHLPQHGAGFRLLTESMCSPTLASQIRNLLGRFPAAGWHQWDPASQDGARGGARLAFGEYVDAQFRFDQADVIVALEADFLACGPGGLRYARDFAQRRRPEQADAMNRLYAIESMPSATGSRADHRFVCRPSEMLPVAYSLAAAVGAPGPPAPGGPARLPDVLAKVVAAIAADLRAHRSRSLVLAGDSQPGVVHALAHAMNQALGNSGSTVVYTDPVEAEPIDQLESLRTLAADMHAGKVDALLIIGGNPVYTAPADLRFADAMRKVAFRARLGVYADETSALCQWHVPQAHFLESWSDARAYDGTASIVQPLIAPLYDGRSAHDVFTALTDQPDRTAYDIVRSFWAQQGAAQGNDFESQWRRWLHDGVIGGTAFAPRSVSLNGRAVADAAAAAMARTPPQDSARFEVAFRNDPAVLDGRFANNGWLQELPKPITKLTWDNAVLVSPSTAAKLTSVPFPAFQGGEHGQIITTVVEVRYGGRSVRGALFPVVGHPDGCATLHLGYGRTRGGRIADGAGFDANALRTSDSPWAIAGADIVATNETFSLACTQYHHLMEGRGMVRAVTRDAFLQNPGALREGDETPPRTITLFPDYRYEGYRWGMAIDVNACIGCNACVIACQAENNIPVVGKDQVLRGREMHWIRVDTYYRGRLENPETYFQPVPCMQCENAPCEVVCPVGATVHSYEGLNDMVYNRCVGTRYCSNNCPYKVRRFNFLLYQDWDTPSLKLGRNPDVTVRSRGVMEKCTYCVQRITETRIEAEKQGRRIRDGEVVPACAQTCPAQAIVFGDLNDPGSRVAALQAEPRNYSLLGELNTRPRTTYLAAVRNVNPDIGDGS